MKRSSYALVVLVFCGGCATHLPGPSQWQFMSAEQLKQTQQIKALEGQADDKAVLAYREMLEKTKVDQPYPHYQSRLQEALTSLQSNPGEAKFAKDVELGLPIVYAQRLQSFVNSYQGMARIHKSRGDFDGALSQADESISVTKSFGTYFPHWSAESLLASYLIKQEACAGKGLVGQALVARLNADMLSDHLNSEGGKEDASIEQKFLSGEESQKQMKDLDGLIGQINSYRSQQASQQFNSITSGLLQANSMMQSLNAAKALNRSGGVMTPQVQMAQTNAQLAQMQATLFTTLTLTSADLSPKFTTVGGQWAVPSFGQQMVDPRQGINARGIVKTFAGQAAEQSGNPNLNAAAAQIKAAVDALPVVQNGQVTGEVSNRVSEFASLLNPFIEQVIAIKSLK